MRTMRRNQIIVLGIVIAVLSCPALPGPLMATGSRVTPSLLSPEKKEIFAVDQPPFATAEIPGGGLFSEIVLEALRAEHVAAVIETLPLTRLLRYYLFHDISVAVLAEGWDFTDKEREKLIVVPFYVVSGRYFYYKPAHREPIPWNEGLVSTKSHTYGVKWRDKVDAASQAGTDITYDRPLSLFKNLKSGILSFISAPDIVANWIIDKQFPKDKDRFGRMEIAGWEVPACIIFSKKHSEGQTTAKRFIRGLSEIIRNGRYDEILEKYQGAGQTPADYKERLEYYWKGERMAIPWGESK